MVGDHHVEVRREGGTIGAFVSDAWRRPVRPRAAWASFDRREPAPLRWDRDRLVGPDPPDAREVELTVDLADGTRLRVAFDLGASPVR